MQILQSWKIYLDTCCLNRLFDPQIQERICRETEAIEMIFSHIYVGGLHWIASGVLRFEITQNPDLEQRANLEDLLRAAYETVLVGTTEIAQRIAGDSEGCKHVISSY